MGEILTMAVVQTCHIHVLAALSICNADVQLPRHIGTFKRGGTYYGKGPGPEGVHASSPLTIGDCPLC